MGIFESDIHLESLISYFSFIFIEKSKNEYPDNVSIGKNIDSIVLEELLNLLNSPIPLILGQCRGMSS